MPYIRTWKKPITIARHAYGDIYRAVECSAEAGDTAELVVSRQGAEFLRTPIYRFEGAGVVQGAYNKDASIEAFADSCFRFALEEKQDLWFSCKDTISKTYDGRFRDIFARLYEEKYKALFEAEGLSYLYTLIDDAVARAVRSEGGFLWACKNYDGDVMSDMIASGFGSIAMMRSVLVSPPETGSMRPPMEQSPGTTGAICAESSPPPTRLQLFLPGPADSAGAAS